MEVLEKVIKVLAEYKEVDASTITADTTFEELELDSLDTVDLVMELENEFGITIEMEDQKLSTVGDIAALVEKSLA